MSKTWSISEIARLTGTTSRTLRHYDAIGLLPPTSVSDSGYRHYDAAALVRLQRILVLREMGMALTEIAAVVNDGASEQEALAHLAAQLRQEADRVNRQLASVEQSIQSLNRGEQLMAEKMFEGWDNSQWEQEVTEKYGKDAWDQSNSWWEGKSADDKSAIEREAGEISAAWQRLFAANAPVDGEEAQALAKQHIAFISQMPGTPDDKQYFVLCLADMYVEDERFAANYGGKEGAEYLRKVVRAYYGVAE